MVMISAAPVQKRSVLGRCIPRVVRVSMDRGGVRSSVELMVGEWVRLTARMSIAPIVVSVPMSMAPTIPVVVRVSVFVGSVQPSVSMSGMLMVRPRSNPMRV